MSDRLEEIKRTGFATYGEVTWLIEEVERLREETRRHQNANLVRAVLAGYHDEAVTDIINTGAFDKVPWIIAEKMRIKSAALRGALQALVDAIDAPWWTWADTNAARAVAVAVLTGQEERPEPVCRCGPEYNPRCPTHGIKPIKHVKAEPRLTGQEPT